MRWVEIAITTTPQAAEAVANILLETRVGGVQEETPRSGQVVLRAYLPVGPATDVTLRAIARRVRALPRVGLDIGPGRIRTRVVEDEGWAHAWKRYVRPRPVGRTLWITPTWEAEPPPPGRVVVSLDPGMAFGTGLHPSTRQCLEVLEDCLRGGEVVLDVGTGSGILAIAAARLGAARVVAVDVDPVAVEVATRNVVHNGVADRVEVRVGTFLRDVPEQGDLIVANLTADLHLEFVAEAAAHLRPGGRLAAAGIGADRCLEVEAVARACGWTVVERRAEEEWRCLVLARADSG
ncbi:MAG: 50S ribosomal protein L11 methyltransferase [Armatimonadota bacterium]|nr:50S ribosomal protein L11 methyltransferase [Armatimonadota bacterium]MDR7582998.1 50S ribosomal protein L11 methyltransferase [Armatimonadota bacterium]MDR7588384.1 50S ribosomal protein L11 methyltransferase [Armatimonadota bacterium]MDR7612537.1 50S ribosomal protein L11 methyltransferase [Armatimonadota bacterium]